MKHIIRVNINGYSLYSEMNSNNFCECDLDVVSKHISENYISAQKRIDAMINTKISRWHFSIANINSNLNPIIAYGCYLPIEDDEGRQGLTFIHAIECNDNDRIDEIIQKISKFLTPTTTNYLCLLLSKGAKNSEHKQKLFDFITQSYSEILICKSNVVHNFTKSIKKITYDCIGAQPAGWLIIAISHLDKPSPWEIFEEYSETSEAISINSTYLDATEKILLSELLFRFIQAYYVITNLSIQEDNLENKNEHAISTAILQSEKKIISDQNSLLKIHIQANCTMEISDSALIFIDSVNNDKYKIHINNFITYQETEETIEISIDNSSILGIYKKEKTLILQVNQISTDKFKKIKTLLENFKKTNKPRGFFTLDS